MKDYNVYEIVKFNEDLSTESYFEMFGKSLDREYQFTCALTMIGKMPTRIVLTINLQCWLDLGCTAIVLAVNIADCLSEDPGPTSYFFSGCDEMEFGIPRMPFVTMLVFDPHPSRTQGRPK